MRTSAGGRAVSLAALAALLVVLSSADAVRASSQGVREALQARPVHRASVVGLGRIVEGLLACASVPDEGQSVPPIEAASIVARPAQVAWAPAVAFGLAHLTDLPPPAVA